jgi:hypothetical protein
MCHSCQQLHDNAVINLSQQKHCSDIGNSLVCHVFASTVMNDNAVHIYQASNTLLFYVFPVSCY